MHTSTTLILFTVIIVVFSKTCSKVDQKIFTASIQAYKVPDYFKYSSEDFVILYFTLFQYGQHDLKLKLMCDIARKYESNCIKMIIGIKIAENQRILVKFYGLPGELGDYKNWKEISRFELNYSERWVILYDEYNGFLIFGLDYVRSPFKREKIVSILSERIGKVPDYAVPLKYDYQKNYCPLKASTNCSDPEAEYDRERLSLNGIRKSWIIYIAIVGSIVFLVTVILLYFKISNIEFWVT